MRAAILMCLMASIAVVAALPQANVCSSEQVQLELRPVAMNEYQLSFVAIDPSASHKKADFIDIHYRVNNEESVNLRVLTEAAMTSENERAKHALVDGIQLDAGDVIRAYATYASNGIACDTPIHTFNAPEMQQQRISRRAFDTQAIDRRPLRRPIVMSEEDAFWTQAAIEAEQNHAQGACPAIAMDTDILKMAGQRNTYVLSFENKTPGKQLHYVDLHYATDADQGWENLRLASDMQLDLAHKVMQPGVVVNPNEQLSWYWSYRTQNAEGVAVDCTTPVHTISPHEVTHEVDLTNVIQRA